MSCVLTDNALAVLEKRYIRKDQDGRPVETVDQMFHRVASNVAMHDSSYEIFSEAYEKMMKSLLFLPNTPTFTGAGTPLGQLAACFVLAIEDDIGKDTSQGIFSTLRTAALIQQSGGGVGFSFSRLRPKGDRVFSSSGLASGPISFMKVYDAALRTIEPGQGEEVDETYTIGEEVVGTVLQPPAVACGPVHYMSIYNEAFTAIAQGGTRRGASMGVLRVDHPDIMEFISCKEDQHVLNGFNISVGVTDKFMRSLSHKEGIFELINPRTGKAVSTVDQNMLMNSIVSHAYKNGEPGVLFLDTINKRNPVPKLYQIETTNPCVTIDTMIETSIGEVPVSSLIGKMFRTHEGSVCKTGFFKTALVKPYVIVTKSGRKLRCSENHRLLTDKDRWVEAAKIRVGDSLKVYGGLTDSEIVTVVAQSEDFESVYDCTVSSSFHCYVSNGFYSHNCGEQALGPNENCCLGSINLAKHLIMHESGPADLDWAKLANTTRTAVRMLDDIVTANRYVEAAPQLREAALRCRRIGLGFMGLADVLMAMRIRYGSQSGIDTTKKIVAFIQMNAMMESSQLAVVRGPFPAIRDSIYGENFTWTPPQVYTDMTPKESWDQLVQLIKRNGLRNAAVTTVAPTGTIGTVASVEGYGVEPAFALSYTRNVRREDGSIMKLKYASPLFADACRKAGVEQSSEAYQQVLRTGSCQGVDGIPPWVQETFVTARDLTWKEHVDMQAAVQQIVSNSVSKTINFPATATEKDVLKAYMYAWSVGCCGLTVYVDGSRDNAVLQTEVACKKK